MRFVAFPTASLPAGSYRTIGDLLPAGKKRVALRPMQPNELILSSKISGEGQSASIAALLPDGKRAAAVRLNDVSGVAGFIQPNDSVDVLVTRTAGDGTGGSARQLTDVLLQNVRIIAIDQNAKNADGTPSIAKTATLEVDPLDAQKLALGQQVGQLSLVLRKPGEEQNNPLVETVSLEDLRYSVYGGARYAGGYGQSLAAAFEPARARVAMAAAPSSAPAPCGARRGPLRARPSRSIATASRSSGGRRAKLMWWGVMAHKSLAGARWSQRPPCWRSALRRPPPARPAASALPTALAPAKSRSRSTRAR